MIVHPDKSGKLCNKQQSIRLFEMGNCHIIYGQNSQTCPSALKIYCFQFIVQRTWETLPDGRMWKITLIQLNPRLNSTLETNFDSFTLSNTRQMFMISDFSKKKQLSSMMDSKIFHSSSCSFFFSVDNEAQTIDINETFDGPRKVTL